MTWGRRKPAPESKRAVKRDEKALSGSKFHCDACSLSFGTAEMLGIHKVVAHG